MPQLDKAERRDKKREKRSMPMSGRGLITDSPNVERRREKELSKRKRHNGKKRT
jgi:hypothetical protein